jgi:hypothetical protein
VLLDATIDDAAVRAVSFARVPEAVLRTAVDETAGLIRPRQDDAIDFFGTRYGTIRQFAPAFLRTLTFHTHGPDDTVLRAVEVIRALDGELTRRPVLRDAPMAIVTDAWRPYIREPDGGISRRYYELCTLWPLRSALRAGNIWVEHSRRDANPDTYLIPPAEWSRWRPAVVRQTGTPSQGLERLHEREAELETTMAQVERLLARKDSHLRIEEDQLVLSPLEASPRPARADALADRIAERLPRVELPELLIEVDSWTHFSQHLVHAANMEGVRPARLPHLYASLLAHACNFGLEQMAHLTDLAYDHLAWCTTWYSARRPSKPPSPRWSTITIVSHSVSSGGAVSFPPRMASGFPSLAKRGTPARFPHRSAMAWGSPFIVGPRISSRNMAPNMCP